MSLTEIQLRSVQEMMDEHIRRVRPPEDIRHMLDMGWRLEKQSIFLFEIRPLWTDETKILHHDYAKATWVERAREWRIYWLRASGKWDRYDPLPSVGNLKRFLMEVEKDPYCCFFG